ncbi:uncharacterized protein [Triticum aestivum]|uniref:uncharacterized protein isoform X4 n=1 Tax=Triticum aestivum TaxID=4565 RepID=UPI001D0179A7|nr:uncharacterized protein LOC123050688 isoform X4 [Triticum aestivum]
MAMARAVARVLTPLRLPFECWRMTPSPMLAEVQVSPRVVGSDAMQVSWMELQVPMELSELCNVPVEKCVKNPIQVALHLANEQISGSSLLGFWSVREHANGENVKELT